MQINIIGTIFGQSGYDSHTRSLVNALHEEGADVRLEVQKPNQWERQVNDAELNMLTKDLEKEHVSIMISTPPNWRLVLADNPSYFMGFLVWEGDSIPAYWKEYLEDPRVNRILVPSQHTYEAIVRGCGFDDILKKIEIIPHGVDPSIFYNIENKEKRPFTFLANKGWNKGKNDRGGMQYVIEAFSEEFTSKDDVCLKIKINSSYNDSKWNFKEECKKLNLKGLTKKDKPVMMVNEGKVQFKELVQFYKGGDVFVSPTMAEAFNLPCLEAMSCGLPVITTDFGGQTDYVDNKNGILIGGKMVDVTWDIMYEGIKWKRPSIVQLRRAMRRLYEDRALTKGKSWKSFKTSQDFTWRITAKKLLNHINSMNI